VQDDLEGTTAGHSSSEGRGGSQRAVTVDRQLTVERERSEREA
jgi:hypothetical protein